MDDKKEKSAAYSPDYPSEEDTEDDEIDYSVKPDFYDPDLDTKDETWVHNRIKGRTSDAILSCPACFTILCLDCQQHEKYPTQFRAMFVENCKIKDNQILREKKRKRKNSGGSISLTNASNISETAAIFKPVCCLVCSTEVGVLDEDEVYHFFNVLAINYAKVVSIFQFWEIAGPDLRSYFAPFCLILVDFYPFNKEAELQSKKIFFSLLSPISYPGRKEEDSDEASSQPCSWTTTKCKIKTRQPNPTRKGQRNRKKTQGRYGFSSSIA
ncbi:hypothetical protein H6P81_017815 [Aristolochia fimbriata]|uniref:E2F-associated phosphoprotein n=1 Tax=Aristolochia fimbriata TaxID=158543 RepID=A0AAV7E2C2_ARIFI|nr:hypothetical protein H6P81_017815 [Aristolochia fimbriata]